MRVYLNKIVAFGLLSFALHVGAQKPAGNNYNPPRAPLPRYLEDYSALDTLDRDKLYLDLKYLPAAKNTYFSFGWETRQRYEYFHNYRLGQADQDPNGYLISRFLLHADFHHKDWFRIFSQFSYTDVYGRTQGARYPDRDRLAVHQLFLELKYSLRGIVLNLQAGRREYAFGNNRWMAYREGPNTRRSFDGINLRIQAGFILDLFYLAPVDLGPENLDNRTEWDYKLLGFHLGSKNWIPRHELNLYGIYFETEPGLPFMGQSAKKYSLGIRDKLVLPRFEADGELMLQLAFPGDSITNAFMLGLDIRLKPLLHYQRLTVGLDMLYTSGYRNSNHMTYQSLFPSYLSARDMDLFGKHNLVYLEPYLWWFPSGKNKFTFETNFYLRSSKRDHVYSIPGFVLYEMDEFSASYLGAQFSLLYTRYWNPFIFTMLQYTRFQTSEGLSSTGASHMNMVFLVLTLRF